MPRLFTGLEIPTAANQELSLLRGGIEGARWIDPENYHITLNFIGDIDNATANEVIAGLEKIDSGAVAIRITGFGMFGGKKPFNLHAKVELSDALLKLQQSNARVLQRIGLELERRKFVPHVTIARIGGVKSAKIERWMIRKEDFSVPEFVAERFVLYSAKESIGGGPYVVEAGYPFRL